MWYYPADRLIVLWECFPEERYHGSADATHDATLHVLWDGFEGWLINRFADAGRLVTTWEDLYEREPWRRFLAERGYHPVAPAAFAKDRLPPAQPPTDHAP